MERITAYRTFDGKVFTSEEEAQAHEEDYMAGNECRKARMDAYFHFRRRLMEYTDTTDRIRANVLFFLVCSLDNFSMFKKIGQLYANPYCPSEQDIFDMVTESNSSGGLEYFRKGEDPCSKEMADEIDWRLGFLNKINPELFTMGKQELTKLYLRFPAVRVMLSIKNDFPDFCTKMGYGNFVNTKAYYGEDCEVDWKDTVIDREAGRFVKNIS